MKGNVVSTEKIALTLIILKRTEREYGNRTDEVSLFKIHSKPYIFVTIVHCELLLYLLGIICCIGIFYMLYISLLQLFYSCQFSN